MTTTPHFEVDKKGLAKLLARRGIEFAVLELVQNALDEDVTTVHVTLATDTRGHYRLTVTDDNPDGFADLRHAYTLFAESKKKTDATKRGRFNLGEKLVIAVSRLTIITTTTGTVMFDEHGRHLGRGKREKGTCVEVVLRMTHEEAERTRAAVRSVLVPPTVALILDGERQPSREMLALIHATLPTELADEDGYLRQAHRHTSIELYEPRDGEVPTLYELGIPVVETGDRWHVSIGQKVPLNSDRDNVTPSYLRRVRATVLNARPEFLTPEIASTAWVTDVLASDLASAEAVTEIVAQRYGEKRVVRDPSDPEATKIAVSMGYAVIEPGSFSKAAWDNIRSAGAALPAGKVTPSPKPYSDDGEDLKILPREKWTPGMVAFAELASEVGAIAMQALPQGRLDLKIVTEATWPFAATYGRGGHLVVNLGRVGHKFFDDQTRAGRVERVRLLVHEFGHEYSSDHLSSEYHEALCKIGARLFLGAP